MMQLKSAFQAIAHQKTLVGFGSALFPFLLIHSTLARPIVQPIEGQTVVQAETVRAAQYTPERNTSEQYTSEQYTSEQIKYFLEIAMRAEYSDQNAVAQIRKWQKNIKIKTVGTPTKADLETLSQVIYEINQLTQENLHLELVDNNPNITIHFVPEWNFTQIDPGYRAINYGYFRTQETGGTIEQANLLISSEVVTQPQRSHLIREELTQSLGLMNDSYSHPTSMFHQAWSEQAEYAPIDRALIKMLYHPSIRPGMTQAQVLDVFNSLQANSTSVSKTTQKLAQCNSQTGALDFSLNCR